MQEEEFLKFYLQKEVEKMNIENKDNAQTLLALLGLQRLKVGNGYHYSQNDLKKLAGFLTR